MATVEYRGVTEARASFKDLLDAAAAGNPVGVQRADRRFLVVDAARLRHFLAGIGPRAEVVVEEDGSWWSLFFPGLPFMGEGESLEAAVEDAIVVLREYAEDWIDRLGAAPSHAGNWGLVQLVSASDDHQLREWLVGFAR